MITIPIITRSRTGLVVTSVSGWFCDTWIWSTGSRRRYLLWLSSGQSKPQIWSCQSRLPPSACTLLLLFHYYCSSFSEAPPILGPAHRPIDLPMMFHTSCSVLPFPFPNDLMQFFQQMQIFDFFFLPLSFLLDQQLGNLLRFIVEMGDLRGALPSFIVSSKQDTWPNWKVNTSAFLFLIGQVCPSPSQHFPSKSWNPFLIWFFILF